MGQFQVDMTKALPCEFTFLVPGDNFTDLTVVLSPLTPAVRAKAEAIAARYPQFRVRFVQGALSMSSQNAQTKAIVAALGTLAPGATWGMGGDSTGRLDVKIYGVSQANIAAVTAAVYAAAASAGGPKPKVTVSSGPSPFHG